MLITGTFGGIYGMYLLSKQITKSVYASLFSATLFAYFTYRAVVLFVRGAFAEFIAMSILPFLFFALHKLNEKTSLKSSVFFGVIFALLILTHPLIAFPAVIFIFLYGLYYVYFSKNKILYATYLSLGSLIGVGLSAFFWMPSFFERSLTMTDDILLKELADY